MILSILIPTVYGREAEFSHLIDCLSAQWNEHCEMRYMIDNKEMSIGAKRQQLLEACETEYFVMIDDDDLVADDYIPQVLKALEQKPDCVCYLESVNGETACHSNKYQDWHDFKDGYRHARTPFYKDVLRTDIAKQISFADLRYGEDYDFAQRLKKSGLLRKEVFIDKHMYFYTSKPLSNKEHKERYGIK